jgi:hypothetical protein
MHYHKSLYGSILEFKYQPKDILTRAYLYNFRIGGSELKLFHKRWLDDHIIKPLTLAKPIAAGSKNYWSIWLMGTTSRTGGDVSNMQLSSQRAIRVHDHLRAGLGEGPWKFDYYGWAGEQLAVESGDADNTELPLRRAVQIAVQYVEKLPPPPPPPPVEPPHSRLHWHCNLNYPDDPNNKLYYIRLLGGVNVSGGPAALDGLVFQIVDETKKNPANYLFVGFGPGLGPPIKKLPPVLGGANFPGPWNCFEAPRAKTTAGFEGKASFQYLGINAGTSISIGELEFGGFRFPGGYLVDIRNFHTGRTIALPGISFTDGSLWYLGRP